MFLTSFYSCPQGRAINPSTIGEAILDRADSAEEHYQRLANLFPVVCDKMSAPLVRFMTKTRIAYDSDCGHGLQWSGAAASPITPIRLAPTSRGRY